MSNVPPAPPTRGPRFHVSPQVSATRSILDQGWHARTRNNHSPVVIEVRAHSAMFTRTDSNVHSVSGLIPAYSIVKGVFDNIFRVSNIRWNPLTVVYLKEPTLDFVTIKNGSPTRKQALISEGASSLVHTRVLRDVHFLFYADVVPLHPNVGPQDIGHLLRHFNKHVRAGTASQGGVWLGRKDCPALVDVPNPDVRPCPINLTEWRVLRSMWDNEGKPQISYYPELTVRNGILHYPAAYEVSQLPGHQPI